MLSARPRRVPRQISTRSRASSPSTSSSPARPTSPGKARLREAGEEDDRIPIFVGSEYLAWNHVSSHQRQRSRWQRPRSCRGRIWSWSRIRRI
ncbi:hypothetical protein EUGRSUZ_H03509 [Eucalyptus grandis]|uniref:Uncharacterized protein n=2 Tax=Eucalyptus grandis TaxID=71139 RepID=A0ACC3JVE0_EUCGR|nr:hypothetical protein EUGRSUZ_H03509 [Eucalyptus grandis]